MNRLQKKCFIASAGFHLLLFLVLLVGPAFLAPKNRLPDLPPITVVPTSLTDAAVTPNAPGHAQVAPAPPPAPTQTHPTPPTPHPVREHRPEPPAPVEETRHNRDSLDPPHKTKLPNVNTNYVTRKSNTHPSTRTQTSEADSQAHERQVADAHRAALAKGVLDAAGKVQGFAHDATTVEAPGNGMTGPAAANYAQYVKTLYENAWVLPDDTATDDAITKVSVTIESDGTVLVARITRASGDTQVDRSVQQTLDRVTYVAPFPSGAKEKQRTYILNFNLKAKRGLA